MKRNKQSYRQAWIGIDPGSSSGGLALICPKAGKNGIKLDCSAIRFKDMTAKELCDWFKLFKKLDPVAIIEKVHVMPGTGARAATSFMRHTGMVLGFLMALNIPFKEITPQTWMKYYGMKKKKGETKTLWKKRLKQKAQELYPDAHIVTETGDATLIAEYCRKNF